jgi:hypothetical protein
MAAAYLCVLPPQCYSRLPLVNELQKGCIPAAAIYLTIEDRGQ